MPQDAARRALLSEIAALRIGNVDFPLLEARLDQLKLLDTADASLGSTRRRSIKDAAWVLTLVATVIAVCSSVRVPTAAASFESSTRKVRLALSEVIFFEQIDIVDGRVVAAPGMFRSADAGTRVAQDSVGQHYAISDVVARGPVTLSVSSEGQCVALEVNEGTLVGALWTVDKRRASAANAPADDLAATEFALTPTSGALQLCGRLKTPWHLIGSPSTIEFIDRNPFGIQRAVTLAPLVSADVTLAGKLFHLGRENMLRLAFVAGDPGAANLAARIDAVGAAIAVTASGTVDSASWNIGQAAVDRMPSWFEYFAENAKWVLSYSALAGFFGVLWAARKLLRE